MQCSISDPGTWCFGLFSVIGSFVTWQQLLAIMAGAVAAGAVMALGKMWMRRNMSYRFRYFFMYLYGCIQAKKLHPYYQLQVQGDEGVIPFAVAVTVSAMYVLY